MGAYIWELMYLACVKFFYVNEECVSSALQQLVEMRGMEGETQYWSYIGRELVR